MAGAGRRPRPDTGEISTGSADSSPASPAEEPASKRRRGPAECRQGTGIASRRRQAACHACRVRKVKCDKVRPQCAVCKSTGNTCEYPTEGDEKLTLEVATNSLARRLDQLQADVTLIKQSTHHLAGAPELAQLPGPSAWADTSPRPFVRDASPPWEPSRDFLQIPACKTSADAILEWEIFRGKYPENALIGPLFLHDRRDSGSSGSKSLLSPGSDDVLPLASGLQLPDEEQIPLLIDAFLQNVHTKNPILDVESLVKHGRHCAEHGIGWDGLSCLVLLACALGFVGLPYGSANTTSQAGVSLGGAAAGSSSAAHTRLWSRNLRQGDSCFALACRRLGSLSHTRVGSQCYFFAGVYLMYTLRPIESWKYFFQASLLYRMYIRTTHGISQTSLQFVGSSPPNQDRAHRKIRRLEQSLYWSCFKSESEFRVELPLPQSELSWVEFPNPFPSPPSPVAGDRNDRSPSDVLDHHSMDDYCQADAEEQELRQHAKRLCSEEESWYYYLTEIALRRIGNQIINTFFRQYRSSWRNVKPLLRMAQVFEAQVSSWSAYLPPAMQHYETTSIIRAPHLNTGSGEQSGNHVSRELSWAVDNRLLEMQTWLYQPFLYYLIHVGVDSRSIFETYHHRDDHAAGGSLDNDDLAILHALVASGIDCNLKTLDVRSLGHRHHGLWYDLRSIMSASLLLLGVIRSGNANWLPGGVDAVWGGGADPPREQGHGGGSAQLGGRIGRVLAQFEFWANECPDLLRYKNLLEDAARATIAAYEGSAVLS